LASKLIWQRGKQRYQMKRRPSFEKQAKSCLILRQFTNFTKSPNYT